MQKIIIFYKDYYINNKQEYHSSILLLFFTILSVQAVNTKPVYKLVLQFIQKLSQALNKYLPVLRDFIDLYMVYQKHTIFNKFTNSMMYKIL